MANAPEQDPGEPYDDEAVRYIRNELGGVHQVSERHFWQVLHEKTNSGNSFLLPGFAEITEAEAKKVLPQAFGGADPQVKPISAIPGQPSTPKSE